MELLFAKTANRRSKYMGAKLDPKVAEAVMLKNNLQPLTKYPGAAKPWKVKCLICGTTGSPTYAHVNHRGGGCKECGRIRAADAKRLSPDEAVAFMKSKGYLPQEPFHEGKTPWRSLHLVCGNYVSPQYTNVAGGQGGCLHCGKLESARKRRLDNDEVTKEIIELGFRPLETYPGSKSRWKCECTNCLAEFTTSLENARTGTRPLCNKCNRSRMGKLRRVPSEAAIAEMKRVGLSAVGEFPGTHTSWTCTCDVCGSLTSLGINAARLRVAKDARTPAMGCEKCVYAAIGKSRLLDQEEAERRLIELNMRPIGIYVGTFEPILAVCMSCGTENNVQLGKAYSRGRACAVCSLKHRTDMARKPEDEAVAEMLQAGFRPLEPYAGINLPWRSTHLECGQEVSPRLASIKKQSGCSFCAKYGFDSASPAILYVLTNKKFGAIKIGITGIETTRLQSLSRRHGWETAHQFRFTTGIKARAIERLVLNWWRQDLALPVGVLPEDAGSLGGWTETVPSNQMSAEETIEFVSRILSETKS